MSEESRLARTEILVGPEGIEKLASTTVMVFGLGGVGSNCVEPLARSGVGRFIIVDHDVVAPSNINRQAIAFTNTVGQKKVDVMRGMIHAINPDAEVKTYDRFILPDSTPDFFEERPDFLIDAIDTITAKVSLALYAQEHGIAMVSSMGAGHKTRPEFLTFADLYETSVCRVSRVMRKAGRVAGINRLRVLYSTEVSVPAKIDIEIPEGARRGPLGTMSYMPAIMGQMIAGDVIRSITGL